MRPTKSQVKFAQNLYTAMNRVESLAATINSWLSNEEKTAKFSQVLMRSPLARKTIWEVKHNLWCIAVLLREYIDYEQQCYIAFLRDIMNSSLDSISRGGTDEPLSLDACTRELKRLGLAAQTAGEMLRDFFEDYFMSLAWVRKDHIGLPIGTLDVIETRIEDGFFWLEEILSELAEMLQLPSKQATKAGQDNHLAYLNQLLRKQPRAEDNSDNKSAMPLVAAM